MLVNIILTIPKSANHFYFCKTFKLLNKSDMEDGARDKKELYYHNHTSKDQKGSVHWNWRRKRCNFADGPSEADSVLSLQLSQQASHFSCSAHWALVNSVLRRLLHGFASDLMVSLLIVSRALPASTSFGSFGHFLHLYCRHPVGYFSGLPFKRKVFLMRCKLTCGWLRCCALLL